jgi:DNA-binding IclR family transcriptional regulator
VRTLTLAIDRIYFGLDPRRLRAATGRVLSRVQSKVSERAAIRLDELAEDFELDRNASHTLVTRLVEGGLLNRLDSNGATYAITDKFRVLAKAHVISPLPRTRAQLLLQHIGDVADHFNLSATHNKYEIEAIAVFGEYLRGGPTLLGVHIGVTGRHRLPARRPAVGRATRPVEGTKEVRAMFEDLSPYLLVSFYQKLDDLPRPRVIVFRAEE